MTPAPEKAFPVSWEQFHRDCRALTWRLSGLGPFAAVIGITRGGLVPATIVARELDVRIIDTVSIASYDHQEQGEIRLLKSVSDETMRLGGGTGKGLLIVDDLVDTGRTARLVRDLLPDAHFAAVYAKSRKGDVAVLSHCRTKTLLTRRKLLSLAPVAGLMCETDK